MRRPALVPALAAAALVAGLLAVVAPPAQAVGACTRTWDGGAGTSSWNDAANWSPDGVPGGTDTACIANGASVTTNSINVAGLSITNGEVAMQGSGTVGSGGLLVDALSTSQYGRLQAPPDPGELTVNGPVEITGGQVWRNGGGPAGKIRQGAGFPLVLGSKAVVGGTRIFDAASTIIGTLGNAATLSGSAVLNGLVLEVPGKITVAAGTDFAHFNPSSITAQTIETQGDAALGAALTLQAGTSTLGGSLTTRGLSVASSASLAIPASKTLRVIGGGTVAGTLTGTGTFRKETSDQLFVTKTMNVGTLQSTGGDLRVQLGASFTAGRVELAGANGAASLQLSPGVTGTIGSGGLLLDTGNPARTDSYGTIGGGGILNVGGPIDIPGGTIQDLTLSQTGATNGITATVPVNTPPQLLFYNSTITSQGDVSITGTHQVASTGLVAKRLILGSGTNVFDTSNPNTSTYHVGGIVTSGAKPSLSVSPTGLFITATGSNLAGGLTVEGGPTTLSGSLDVPAGATLTAPDLLVQLSGSLLVPPGLLSGAGTVDATVVNKGIVAPGTGGIGTLKIARYSQASEGRLAIELASPSSFDVLHVTGAVDPTIGTIRAICVDGYTPADGQTFDVVTTTTATPVLSSSAIYQCPGEIGSSLVGKVVRLTAVAAALSVPGSPGVTITRKVEALDVTISAPASNGGSPITGYQITCTPTCGTVDAGVGTTTLPNLVPGTTYAVSVVAINAQGSSAPTVVDGVPIAPAATSTVSTTKVVVTTSGSFKVTCKHNNGAIKACGAVLRSTNGTILGKAATATNNAGATSITVTVKITSAGITASKKLGGTVGTLTITTTPLGDDPVATNKKSIKVVAPTTSKTWKSSAYFTSTGSKLTSTGRTALVAVAKAVQGSLKLRCEANVRRTGSATNDYNLGLKRATAVCAFIKATIKAKGWKPVGSYVTKSWGSTKPITLSSAWIKLIAYN